MSTADQAQSTNDGSDHRANVELTQELQPEMRNGTPINDSTKDVSSSFEDDTHPSSVTSASCKSMLSRSSWGTKTIEEMRFTVFSNWMFFVGASLQTFTSVVDLNSALADSLEERDDDSNDDDYVYTALDKTYYVMYSLAPFLFLVIAFVDVHYYKALTGRSPWSLSFWFPCFSHNEDTLVENGDSEHQEQQQYIIEDAYKIERVNSFADGDNSYSASFSTIESSTVEESPYWNFIAAIIFGFGSCFEFYSTFLYDYYQDVDDWDDDAYLIKEERERAWYVTSYTIDFIGMHLYLLSGVICLICQRDFFRHSWKCLFDECRSERGTDTSYRFATLLMLIGSVLFVGGTLMDCIISWISDPSLRHNVDPNIHFSQVTLAVFSLTSSLMWNVDAILYIWADILLYSLLKKGSEGRRWLFNNSSSEEEDEKTDHEYCRLKDDESTPILERVNSTTNYSSILVV